MVHILSRILKILVADDLNFWISVAIVTH